MKLGNTLYILSSETNVTKDGTGLVIRKNKEEIGRFPIHLIDNVVSFTYSKIDARAMKLCSDSNVPISFMSPSGRFISSLSGPIQGNVLLRMAQFRAADNENECVKISRSIVIGKISNCRNVVRRCIRDHPGTDENGDLSKISDNLNNDLNSLITAEGLGTIRGIEGDAAKTYFRALDHMILKNKDDFFLRKRSRRPPKDKMNALLSLSYTILMNDVISAVTAAGLDPFVGFMHTGRPGKPSLALDMMEELRSPVADRFVLNLVNLGQVGAEDFDEDEGDGTVLNECGRRLFIKEWQERKQNEICHKHLGERIKLGLIPHVQSQLLAQYLRGDLNGYQPYMM